MQYIYRIIYICFRYTWTWLQKYREGKKLFIDNLNLVPWRPMYGK